MAGLSGAESTVVDAPEKPPGSDGFVSLWCRLGDTLLTWWICVANDVEDEDDDG